MGPLIVHLRVILMDEAEGRAWAAVAVRELGAASAEIASGLGNGGALVTLAHVRNAKKKAEEAIKCLVYAEGHLKDADPSPLDAGGTDGP